MNIKEPLIESDAAAAQESTAIISLHKKVICEEGENRPKNNHLIRLTSLGCFPCFDKPRIDLLISMAALPQNYLR